MLSALVFQMPSCTEALHLCKGMSFLKSPGAGTLGFPLQSSFSQELGAGLGGKSLSFLASGPVPGVRRGAALLANLPACWQLSR